MRSFDFRHTTDLDIYNLVEGYPRKQQQKTPTKTKEKVYY